MAKLRKPPPPPPLRATHTHQRKLTKKRPSHLHTPSTVRSMPYRENRSLRSTVTTYLRLTTSQSTHTTPSSVHSHTPPQIQNPIKSTAPVAPTRSTIAMAMTDHHISDEALIHELDRMRTDLTDPLDSHIYTAQRLSQSARRTLLACRELVRTERHYNAALHSLLAADTSAPPPPLMLTYLPALAAASNAFLARVEDDPSLSGLATAFIAGEQALENAFVPWCGVVGAFFMQNPDDWAGPRRTRRNSTGGLMRRVNTWRKSMPSIPTLAVSAPGSFVRGRRMSAGPAGGKERKVSVRDLAILPTQRVMRYVLLYRDLLAHTPLPSPSRDLLERAVEAAVRVAQKCDRAQGNAEFLFRRESRASEPCSKL